MTRVQFPTVADPQDLPLDGTVTPVRLSAGSEHDAGCVGVALPTLRWNLASDRQGVAQQAYQIEIASDPSFATVLTRSEPQFTAFPMAEQWLGTPLSSREVRWVRVRIWTDLGVTVWSEALRVEAALISSGDWIARPVSPLSNCGQSGVVPVPYLRKAFHIAKPVASARLYVTALGVHDSWLNGVAVSDAKLDPGWTAYQERLLYAVHDVTASLRQGENVLAAAVGDGWWRGWLTWMERRAVYGDTTAFLAQLEITYADGSVETIASDDTWRGATGGMLEADLYDGFTGDARDEPAGWQSHGFDDSGWEGVKTLPLPVGLELRPMPAVRIVQAWSVTPSPIGEKLWRIDAGQNLAGYLRLRVTGSAGARLTIRHAEVIDDDDTLYTAPLRNAKATDTFVLADGPALLEPSFTFHGFRYAEIQIDGDAVIEQVEVCALSTDMAQSGQFECSDARLNQLFQNVRWSQIGNFVALPTDCPQRDERLGWTGDIQVFADTACINADAGPFLTSWLRDLAIEQRGDGNVPSTVPNVITGHEFEFGGVGWGDAASLVPWSIYGATGDVGLLRQQFASMRHWVDYSASRRDVDGLWTQDFHLGDWLDPGAPVDQPEKATTDSNFIATAYLSRSADVVAQAAQVIGLHELVAHYRALSREVAAAAWGRWKDHLVTTQAGCAVALEFGIVPEDQVTTVGKALADLVARSDGRIATGFLGTPLVLPALTRVGQMEAAYRLLLNEGCPGWLYQVKHGATTMWERWDAIKQDGSLHAGEMTSGGGSSMISFNHYAYGAVANWLYQTVAGIALTPGEAGYRRITFAPRPGGGLTNARAAIATPFGEASTSWTIDGKDSLVLDLRIPAGAAGHVVTPVGWNLTDAAGGALDGLDLTAGRHRLVLAAATAPHPSHA